MQKDDLVYVSHMFDLATTATQKIVGKNRQDYDTDENLRLALTHLLQTIGEAARQVSEQFRKAHPQIPWKAVVGMRHKIVHDYLHVDFDLVWDVVTADLSPLLEQLKKLTP